MVDISIRQNVFVLRPKASIDRPRVLCGKILEAWNHVGDGRRGEEILDVKGDNRATVKVSGRVGKRWPPLSDPSPENMSTQAAIHRRLQQAQKRLLETLQDWIWHP